MIKRYSVLFDRSFRYQMEHKEGFGNCQGVLEALHFINAIVAMCLHPEHKSHHMPAHANSPRTRTAIDKYFIGHSEEHYRLVRIMERATRMHFTLSMSTEHYIRVSVLFFERGEKQPIHEWALPFKDSTGQSD